MPSTEQNSSQPTKLTQPVTAPQQQDGFFITEDLNQEDTKKKGEEIAMVP